MSPDIPPATALVFGVTGHRPRRPPDNGGAPSAGGGGLDPEAARRGFDAIFDSVAREAAALGGDMTSMRLVSSLAEGADRIAARSALQHGLSLDVVLPFPRGAYERTFFDDASRDEFAELLAAAQGRVALATDGLDASEDDRAHGYAAAGMAMLARCHILLAVWDRRPPRGRGGTAEIVEAAARRGVPIVLIDPVDGAAEIRWNRDATPGAPIDRALDRPSLDLETGLPALIASRLRAPIAGDA